MKLSEFKESLSLQTNGAPIAVGNSTFYVRRLGTAESQKALKEIRERLFGPFHKMQESDNHRIYGHWLTEYGVSGWQGLEDQDGALEYSKDAARNIFTNPEYFLSLNDVLISAALRFENYLHDESDKDAEKLEKK